ncbi:hypothetical protein ACTOB_001251 [Actinoplanes oblitus]|uniref:Phage tail protein n=1 Tax=Actinoplanes oblitus TaxID=3040509 RepID=A0ABY8WJ92_9ACTN|nr:hypothetical protein [Actinoplanes oblitus]WIM97703.1 hypothetical protein ACTOB_001251 [Actinoplanes oblitus]
MSKFVLKGTRLFVNAVDLTSVNNKVELMAEVDEQESTAFNPDSATEVWREVLGGIISSKCSAEGQWEAGDPGKVDDAAWAALGAIGPVTICPVGGPVAAGDLAYLTTMLAGDYQIGDQVGNVAPWSLDATGSSPLVRGAALHPPGTARTSTGNGTAVQLGALAADQALYVNLHVLSASGTTPSITVKVQSDDNSGMTSPTDRATFTAATTRDAQTAKIVGAITDDYWRIAWTISGTGPSFLVIVSAGIGPA